MKKISSYKRLLFALLSAILLVLSSVTPTEKTHAESSKSKVASTKAEIHEVFPESYWTGLDVLKDRHPNWKFVAFYTGLTFDECFTRTDGEMYPTRNLVAVSLHKPTSWYSTTVDGAYNWAANAWNGHDSGVWYQASEEAVRYCMDPRNFFTDEQIFQFMDGSLPFTDTELSLTAIRNLLARVGVQHWLLPGETIGLYYETEEENPDYIDYLIRKEEEARQASIDAETAENTDEQTVEESDQALSDPESSDPEDSKQNPDETGEESEESVPPETVMVKHYLSYAEAIDKVGTEVGFNQIMIASRMMQEHGAATSELISGTYPFTLADGTPIPGGYYNYFNFEANGNGIGEIYTNGLREAYREGWDTRYKSIFGGALKYRNKYIAYGQTTLYAQKFNVDSSSSRLFWGQYMQNLTAPQSEAKILYQSLLSVDAVDADYTFVIPVFRNMPAKSPCPTKDGNPNYKLGGIYVNGSILPDYSMDQLTYGTVGSEKRVSSVQIISYAPTTVLSVTAEYNGEKSPVTVSKTTFTEGGQTFGSHSFDLYLEDGDTKVTVCSQAENGDQAIYIFSIHKDEDPAEPPDDPTDPTSGTEEPEPSEPEPEPLLYGDVNGDGIWNIQDITLIGAHILGDASLSGDALERADINYDGKANIQDITIIGAYILGDIATIPQR